MTTSQLTKLFFAAVITLVTVIFLSKLVTTVDANEIVIKQAFWTGNLEVWTDPGTHFQNFGTVTRYNRSEQFWFSEKKDEGTDTDEAIRVRFNDGGHGTLSGSVRFDMPLDVKHILEIHRTFHSQAAIVHELIKQAVTKAVYMTGPLMSSKESSAERRPDLLNYISDQIAHGVYRTQTRQEKMADPLTGEMRTITRVDLVTDAAAPGGFAREEISPIATYGIHTWPITINSLPYDKDIEDQISSQQRSLMAVQLAVAKSKEAEQQTITVEQQGKQLAAQAKWAQEALKAKAVTAAEQERDVAKLSLETAQLNKQKAIAEGEGQAEKAHLLMNANGALEYKGNLYLESIKYMADAISKQKWVPDIQFGASNVTPVSGAMGVMDMLQVKAAKDLMLDTHMTK